MLFIISIKFINLKKFKIQLKNYCVSNIEKKIWYINREVYRKL